MSNRLVTAMAESRQGGKESSRLSTKRPRDTGVPPAVPNGGWRNAATILFLIAVALVCLLYFKSEIDRLESNLTRQASSSERLRMMGKQMDLLGDRLHGLIADSVEIRLKSLERNMAAGKLNDSDLATFQSLQNDLRSLESYSQSPGGQPIDYAASDHPRYRSVGIVPSPEILKELSRLRVLLYLCLTGLVMGAGALAASVWIQSHNNRLLEGSARNSKQTLLPRRR